LNLFVSRLSPCNNQQGICSSWNIDIAVNKARDIDCWKKLLILLYSTVCLLLPVFQNQFGHLRKLHTFFGILQLSIMLCKHTNTFLTLTNLCSVLYSLHINGIENMQSLHLMNNNMIVQGKKIVIRMIIVGWASTEYNFCIS
jgi:hypothetical protein